MRKRILFESRSFFKKIILIRNISVIRLQNLHLLF